MSRICDVCQKGYLRGNLIARGIGRRVARRTTVQKQPNLRYKRFVIEGTSVRMRLCASCLRTMKLVQSTRSQDRSK